MPKQDGIFSSPSGQMTGLDPRDVLDIAESVLGRFGDQHFKAAIALLDEIRAAMTRLKAEDEQDRFAEVDRLVVLMRRIQITLEPVGPTISAHIARDVAEFIPIVRSRLEQGDAAVLAGLESHLSAMSVALKKRFLAPSKPIAAGLLQNLAALRASLLHVAVEQPQVQAEEAEQEQAPAAESGGLWQSLKKLAGLDRS